MVLVRMKTPPRSRSPARRDSPDRITSDAAHAPRAFDKQAEHGDEAEVDEYTFSLSTQGWFIVFLAIGMCTFGSSAVTAITGSTLTAESTHRHMMRNWLSYGGDVVPSEDHKALAWNLNEAVKENKVIETRYVGKIAEQEQKIKELKLTVGAKEKEIAQLKADHTTLINDKDAQISALTVQVSTLTKTIADLEAKNKRLMANVAKLEAQVQSLTAQESNLVSTVGTKDGIITAQVRELDGLKAEVSKLKSELATLKSTPCVDPNTAAMKDTIQRLTADNATLNTKLSKLSKDIRDMLSSISEAIKQANDRNVEVTNMAKALASANVEVTKIMEGINVPDGSSDWSAWLFGAAA